MSFVEPFVRRPVATTLLTLAVALAGVVAFGLLPVAPLPQVDFPTVSVSAQLPGASPEVMAATVATPLERALGRIAGVTEMTSRSSLGSTRITLQFELSRDIDGAAREVQAAIQAARSQLPSSLPNNPTYRKVNPADAPVMILAMTSERLSRGEMYDIASTNLAQRISQVKGVGQVTVGGGSLPAVRAELNPTLLNRLGIGFDQVRAAIAATNANKPKGFLEDGERYWQIEANDQARKAADYAPIVVAYRNGAPVRLGDLGRVVDSVQDLRNYGMSNGRPAVLLIINRQPNANIIDVVDSISAMLPELRASIPAAASLDVMMERTTTIRAALHDVETALAFSVALVILVVFLFLRNARATLIPAVAVPISLVGTFAAMYLLGFSLEQPLPHGARHRHGLRRGRRDRRAGERLAAHRARHVALRGGAARLARGGVHGAVDERVAGGGVHPDPLHGRDHRAALPRVRGDAVGGDRDLAAGLAHDHPDDVRAAAETRRRAPPGPLRARPPSAPSRRCAAATPAASPGRCASPCSCWGSSSPPSPSTSGSSPSCPRASSRSRTRGASSASCAPTSRSRSRRCAPSSTTWPRS